MSASPYEAAGSYVPDVEGAYVSTNRNPELAELQDETAAAFARYRQTRHDDDLHDFLTRATPLVHKYSSGRFSNPTDADDAAQETLLTLLSLARDTELPDEAIVPLIYRVAKFDIIDGHRSLDKAHRALKRLVQEDDEGKEHESIKTEDAGPLPDEIVTGKEELEAVEKLLEGLPPAEKAALRAKFLGIRAVDAARHDNKTPDAYRIALWRARNRTGGPDRPRLKQRTGSWTHADTIAPPIPAEQIPLAEAHLDKLTPRHREVVALALKGMPPRKIVEITGMPIHTVSRHKSLGFDRLRPLLASVTVAGQPEGDTQPEALRRETIATYIAFRFPRVKRPEAVEAITEATLLGTPTVEEQRRGKIIASLFRTIVEIAIEGAPLFQAVSDNLEKLPHPQARDESVRNVYAALIAQAISAPDAASRLNVTVNMARKTAASLHAALNPPVNIPKHVKPPKFQSIDSR